MVGNPPPAARAGRFRDPGPFTSDFQGRTPCSAAFLPASSGHLGGMGRRLAAALKPIMPALDHEIAFALGVGDGDHGVVEAGVHVATPLVMFFRSRRLMRWGSRAIFRVPSNTGEREGGRTPARRRGDLLLLAGDGLALPLRVRALVWCAGREPAGPCDGAGRDNRPGPSTA